MISDSKTLPNGPDLLADSDEAGGAFQTEAGHPFRFHSGRRSDLKPALSEPDPGSH